MCLIYVALSCFVFVSFVLDLVFVGVGCFLIFGCCWLILFCICFNVWRLSVIICLCLLAVVWVDSCLRCVYCVIVLLAGLTLLAWLVYLGAVDWCLGYAVCCCGCGISILLDYVLVGLFWLVVWWRFVFVLCCLLLRVFIMNHLLVVLGVFRLWVCVFSIVFNFYVLFYSLICLLLCFVWVTGCCFTCSLRVFVVKAEYKLFTFVLGIVLWLWFLSYIV